MNWAIWFFFSSLGFATSVPPVAAAEGERVLNYRDLKRLDRSYALAEPDRVIEMRLTGNMEKFFWSFDDKKYSEAQPVPFALGETVRLVLKNETMMNHPIHLHGLWMDLDNGAGEQRPRKHTVIVPPGRTVSVTVTPDAGRNYRVSLTAMPSTGITKWGFAVQATASIASATSPLVTVPNSTASPPVCFFTVKRPMVSRAVRKATASALRAA